MSVILLILKIMGIVLLSLLGLLLLIVLLILFVPLRYKAEVKYEDSTDSLYALGKIRFLWPLVTARIEFKDKKLKLVGRVLGIPVFRNDGKKKNKSEPETGTSVGADTVVEADTAVEAGTAGEAGTAVEADTADETETVGVTGKAAEAGTAGEAGVPDTEEDKNPDESSITEEDRNPDGSSITEEDKNPDGSSVTEEAKDAEDNDPEPVQADVIPIDEYVNPDGEKADGKGTGIFDKIKKFFYSIGSVTAKVIKVFKSISRAGEKLKGLIRNLKNKKDKIMDFLRNERNKNAFKFLWNVLKKALKHILPRKLEGVVEIGLEDPSSTGKVLGGVYALYGVLPKKLHIYPDFTKKKIFADVKAKGHIRVFTLLRLGIKVLRNKDVKYLRKRFKKLTGELKEKNAA